MRAGLLGRKLGHSLSPQIHRFFGDYEYRLYEREPEDVGDRAPCCGYGGLAAYANPEVAGELTEQCLSRGEGPWVTYCMACRDRFARAGQESRHLLELVYGTDAGDPPDISEKRFNRRALKRELLRDYWNEETGGMEPEFKDNDLVLVQAIPSGPELQYGEIGAFIKGNEQFVKVYEEDGLRSLNPKYPFMNFSGTEDTVYIIGRVIGTVDQYKDLASQDDVGKFKRIHDGL